MTKTEARRIADKELRSGYFRPQADQVYTTCSRCKDRINVTVVAWATGRQCCKALHDALVVHLLEGDCQSSA